MKVKLRFIVLGLIFTLGTGLIIIIALGGITTPYESSFAPMYSVLGIMTMEIDMLPGNHGTAGDRLQKLVTSRLIVRLRKFL